MNNLSDKWYRIPTGNKLRPFTFIVGGRGIGKSYDTIGTCVVKYPGAFLYLRNTQTQIKESCGAFGNPFKKWARDHARDIMMKMEGEHAVVYEYIGDEDDREKKILGYGAALSVFENLRSIDLSNIDIVFYEEFIENRSLQFDQFAAFKHMYETINRNRELEGRPPLIVVFLSNAQRLGNPILRGFNLIPVIEGMQRTGQRSATIGNIRIELPFSEISELKRNTALYQGESDKYTDEALNNNFANDSFTGVKKVSLNEYSPVCSIDDIYIYRHKSDSTFYACATPAKGVHNYRSRDHLIVFNRLYGLKLKLAYGSDKILFSDYATKVDLMTILNMLY